MTIADDLYDQVIDFKKFKIENQKYYKRCLTNSTEKTLGRHFTFDLARLKPRKKFSRKLKKIILGLKFLAKDIRMSSISNEMLHPGIQVHHLYEYTLQYEWQEIIK